MLSALSEEYPAQYERRLTLKDGRDVFLRPVRQTDEPLLMDLFHKLSPDALYMRFLRPLQVLPEGLLFRLTHMDYHKNIALAAVIREEGKDTFVAVARYGYDPEDKVTDFAIVVRDDWQHCGLGKFLLLKIFAIGKHHGVSRFVSLMDSTNRVMKQVLRESGCTVTYSYKKGCTEVEVLV